MRCSKSEKLNFFLEMRARCRCSWIILKDIPAVVSHRLTHGLPYIKLHDCHCAAGLWSRATENHRRDTWNTHFFWTCEVTFFLHETTAGLCSSVTEDCEFHPLVVRTRLQNGDYCTFVEWVTLQLRCVNEQGSLTGMKEKCRLNVFLRLWFYLWEHLHLCGRWGKV